MHNLHRQKVCFLLEFEKNNVQFHTEVEIIHNHFDNAYDVRNAGKLKTDSVRVSYILNMAYLQAIGHRMILSPGLPTVGRCKY